MKPTGSRATPVGKWTPGREVEIVASRVRLRSLRATDVPGDEAPAWYGDAARRAHVWSPAAKSGPFLRGLAQACDHARFFALLAFSKADDAAVGLSKGQVLKDSGERLFVLTTLVGEVEWESVALGYEISAATLFFATHFLPIDAISLRVYDDNARVIRSVEHVGYKLQRIFTEKLPDRTERTVRDYRKSKQDWLDSYGERYGHWQVRPAAPPA